MWSGISESPLWDGEPREALQDALHPFLVMANLSALLSLAVVQFKEDFRELPDGITPNEGWIEIFQRPAVVEALNTRLPVWAAEVELAGESLYVHAPKRVAQDAYNFGAGAGPFMRKYLVPQVEMHLLSRESREVVVYDPESVSIHKLRNEHFDEALGVDDMLDNLES
jgi:hypothetical protein